MFGYTYYFGSIRKYIGLFGTLFNDIYIDRIDQSTGNTLKRLLVPLSYGPKDRYLARIKENPDLLREVNQVLPRMTFEIKNVEYDSDRKLNTIGRNKYVIQPGSTLNAQYNPVPYNFNISLSILTRNADDATRIVEQILPFFKPEWTTALNLIPEMGIVMDIPVILKSINYQDTYEGSFTQRYAIVWDLQFVLKGYIYGPVTSSYAVQTANVSFLIPSTNTAAQGVGVSIFAEGNSVKPGLDANGNPTSNASISIPNANITANSNYGYIHDFYNNVGYDN